MWVSEGGASRKLVWKAAAGMTLGHLPRHRLCTQTEATARFESTSKQLVPDERAQELVNTSLAGRKNHGLFSLLGGLVAPPHPLPDYCSSLSPDC